MLAEGKQTKNIFLQKWRKQESEFRGRKHQINIFAEFPVHTYTHSTSFGKQNRTLEIPGIPYSRYRVPIYLYRIVWNNFEGIFLLLPVLNKVPVPSQGWSPICRPAIIVPGSKVHMSLLCIVLDP
jgi:hypothetical protein